MNIVKRILGVLAGVAVGLVFVMAGDYLSSVIHPWQKGLDYHNKEVVANFMLTVPFTAFLVMMVAYAFGAFLGGIVAALITGRSASRPAIIVGIILTIGSIFNQVEIPHPLWFAIAAVLIPIPLAWCGWKLLSPTASA